MPSNTRAPLKFVHCDVFTETPYSGNSLAVFPESHELDDREMLSITQELRHFESIFLNPTEDHYVYQARVFDLFEELPFAGHPIIGAACTLHRQSASADDVTWTFKLTGDRKVQVQTKLREGEYSAVLHQGRPEFLGRIPDAMRAEFSEAFNLLEADFANLPMEVISTGLKYLVIPVRRNLDRAKIVVPDLEEKLRAHGAEFAYLFNPETFEGRHWNNDGVVEDVATGSAAGVVGAYALKHRIVRDGEAFLLKQGHYMGRPSKIEVTAFGDPEDVTSVHVGGPVAFVGTGQLEVLPC
ncbi:PhzF family phenazine biosynthesis protein [Pseudohalocynthiibacter aestuariivivens]|uniref:PhzF family phenazine biosynthesis protein n=1 Tax=Pseudohalocynthiibacter aestuariivivens TaxID=1591409 RepID=A0ABV5JGJ7_9RHOB|nr:PhzF family phenazine biosynthesis protein [Pseudohalocynthiibacter aestuariivivens]MBS9716086.1 PhzF family phenazine biosynthesis protein [Pseudohalocynthiibacter aestuariivivens]